MLWITQLVSLLKTTFPGAYNLVANFFKSFDNSNEGLSMKKILAAGLFWLISKVVLANTNHDNLEYVLTALLGALLSMCGIYSYANYKNNKLSITNKPTDASTIPTDPPADQGG